MIRDTMHNKSDSGAFRGLGSGRGLAAAPGVTSDSKNKSVFTQKHLNLFLDFIDMLNFKINFL